MISSCDVSVLSKYVIMKRCDSWMWWNKRIHKSGTGRERGAITCVAESTVSASCPDWAPGWRDVMTYKSNVNRCCPRPSPGSFPSKPSLPPPRPTAAMNQNQPQQERGYIPIADHGLSVADCVILLCVYVLNAPRDAVQDRQPSDCCFGTSCHSEWNVYSY